MSNNFINNSSNNINTQAQSDSVETLKFTEFSSKTLTSVPQPLEPTFMLADTTDKVEGFFSRPIRIYSAEWAPSVAFNHTIDPWSLYLENDRVRERLSNFHLLRCRMHIRILVNSTPFYYGRLLASYRPLHLVDSKTFFRPGVTADFVEATQRPHVIINPAEDETGELVLPYMHPQSALSISDRQWREMGQLTLMDLNVLRNVNNVTDTLTVSVFAWAEDVCYSQPTSVPIPNEGEYEDMQPQGVVSSKATALARIAGNFISIPVIGLYARATQMAAETTAAIASMFGFSSPRVINPVEPIAVNPWIDISNVNRSFPIQTLALDAKQEITIDPTVTGSGKTDPMAFLPIVKKETFLTSFDWPTTAPPDNLLYNIRVSPMNYVLNVNEVHLTPPAWIATPFRYWRGTLNYRFEVVASKFHRGRLRLVFDPSYQATSEFNVNYGQIIDISDNCSFTMKVGWAQGVPYLVVPELSTSFQYHGAIPYTEPMIGMNGVLSVFVLNSLTTPSVTDKHIYVNVYVSASDDFEVASPRTGNLANVVPKSNGLNPIPATTPGSNVQIPGTYSHMFHTNNSDRLPGIGFNIDNGILIGSTNDDPTFNNNQLFTFGSLAALSVNSQLSFTLTTDAPPGTTLDITTALGTETVMFPTPPSGGVLTSLELSYVVPAGATEMPFTFGNGGAPWTNSLVISDVVGPFSYMSEVSKANTWTLQSTSAYLVNTAPSGHQAGPYVYIPAGGIVTITSFNTGNLTKIMCLAEGGSTNLSFSNGIDTTVVPVAQTLLPTQPGTEVSIVTNEITVTNTGSVPARLYSFTIDGLSNEGDVVETEVAGQASSEPSLAQIFMGESVHSIRQILKRATHTYSLPIFGSNANYKAFRALPLGDANPQLPLQTSLWDWFIPAFVGYKGGVRVGAFSTRNTGRMSVNRLPDGAATFDRTTMGYFTLVDVPITWAGSAITANGTALRTEVPFYSNMRFLPARAAGTNFYYDFPPMYQLTLAPEVNDRVQIIQSIGEDFSTYFFLCTPVLTPSP